MDKKTILAFVLILAVFWISSELVWKPRATTEEAEARQQEQTLVEANDSEEMSRKEQGSDNEEPSSEKSSLVLPVEEQGEIEIRDDLVLENDKIKLIFSNLGAGMSAMIIKDYLTPDGDKQVNLLRDQSRYLEMKFNETNNEVIAVPEVYNWSQPDKNHLIFTQTSAFGEIRKEFILDEGYVLGMNLEIESVKDQFNYQFSFADGIADTERYLKRKKQNYQIVAEVDNKVERINLGKLKKNQEEDGKIEWVVLRNKFFAMGLQKDELSDLYGIKAFNNNDSPAFWLQGRSIRSNLSANYQLYVGPAVFENMSRIGENFANASYAGNGVFFGQGFIKPISKAFSWIFMQFHKVIPSFGICLILFSILIKIILYPLTHKSFESSTKLQKIQPLITELREKHKNDPQKMNQEMQRIYRENGVSPMGGCLPMLLQMPIFFALYPVIRYSINLRQAGFLWLKDLSEPDPYLILPILMAIFMFLQQYLMQPRKEALDKMSDQQKAQMQSQRMMMYIMPVMMFFIFKGFPGGLVLYWTVFNIMSMFQQRIIKKKFS